ncbi:MAG: ATP-binding protein [Candidatus Hydrogenedentes bacterium]|nr:ATP-binding protein [Candidatus Hydrogenedentota bacterium]
MKVAITITAMVSGVAFTIGAAIVTLDWWRFHNDLEEKALLLAHSVAVAAPEAILRSDYWLLFKSLKKMAAQGPGNIHRTRILTAMVIDPEGKVLAHLQPSENPLGMLLAHSDEEEARLMETSMAARSPIVLDGDIGSDWVLEGVVPVFSDQKLLGVVRVRLSHDELYLKTERSALIILGLTLALATIGSLSGVAISRRITKPLTTVTEGMEAMCRGEFTDIEPVQVIDDDELGRLVATFNQMTVEMAEKKLMEEQMAVSEKLAALGRITAGVAHEVNNPLAGLLNCIDTLKKHPDDKQLMERYLPLLDKGLNRIRNIVGSLLVELRVEDAREVSGLSCLEDLRDIVEAEIDGREIDLVWENHLDDRIKVNSRRVQQVILNLLKNAVQAVPDGGTVAFHSFQDANCVVLEVDDNGPGIPPGNRSQIFDPFFTTKPNGTGLGLWIVYRLVESMHGVIVVESEVGRGTQFRVTLPATEVVT